MSVEDVNNSIYLTGLLQGLNNMVSVKSIASCLAQSKCPVNIDYCYRVPVADTDAASTMFPFPT